VNEDQEIRDRALKRALALEQSRSLPNPLMFRNDDLSPGLPH